MEVSLSHYTTRLASRWLENGSELSDADRWLAERARDARHRGGVFWWVDIDHDDAVTLLDEVNVRLDDVRMFIEDGMGPEYGHELMNLKFDKELLEGI